MPIKPKLRNEVTSRGVKKDKVYNNVIVNAADLDRDSITSKKVLCPCCYEYVFKSWPLGWDSHASYVCEGLNSGRKSDRDSKQEKIDKRKKEFKKRFGKLFGKNRKNRTKLKERVARELKKVAIKGGTVNYNKLASTMKLSPVTKNNWSNHELKYVFDVLDEEDYLKKRPFLTCIVVKKVDQYKIPSLGFWKMIKKYRGKTIDSEDRIKYFSLERVKLKKYWRKNG
ncbi:MAG: hypothetical protein HQL69_03200 [Magnetococcales bacterium]|nr:hypothetical protein [Magnetococcales bacterium]